MFHENERTSVGLIFHPKSSHCYSVCSGVTEAGIGKRTVSSSYWSGSYSNHRWQAHYIRGILSNGVTHPLDSCVRWILQCRAWCGACRTPCIHFLSIRTHVVPNSFDSKAPSHFGLNIFIPYFLKYLSSSQHSEYCRKTVFLCFTLLPACHNTSRLTCRCFLFDAYGYS